MDTLGIYIKKEIKIVKKGEKKVPIFASLTQTELCVVSRSSVCALYCYVLYLDHQCVHYTAMCCI